jgi:hypothetical protein
LLPVEERGDEEFGGVVAYHFRLTVSLGFGPAVDK